MPIAVTLASTSSIWSCTRVSFSRLAKSFRQAKSLATLSLIPCSAGEGLEPPLYFNPGFGRFRPKSGKALLHTVHSAKRELNPMKPGKDRR